MKLANDKDDEEPLKGSICCSCSILPTKTSLKLSQLRPNLLSLLGPADPLKIVLQMLVRAQVARSRMALEILRPSCPSTETAQLSARLGRRHLLVGDGAEKLADPQPTCISRRFARGKDVVCSYALFFSGHPCQPPQLIPSGTRSERTLSPYETQVFSPRNRAP